MSGRLRFFVAALLLSISLIEGRAQAVATPKLFLIWDERGKFGYIDSSGKVVIKPQFDRAYPFAEGVAAVGIGDKSGFIDASGQVVIPFRFHMTYSFSDGVAAVSLSEGTGKDRRFPCGYIDHSNNYVIKPQTKFSCSEPFHEGFAAIEIYDQQIGESLGTYINKEGHEGVASRLAVGKPFSEGLALVNDFVKWSFVNKEGQTVIDLRPNDRSNILADEYEPSSSFSEGLAMVGITVSGSAGYSRYAYMNRKGRIVFKLPGNVRAEGDFHNGRAQIYRASSQRVRVNVGGEIYEEMEDTSARGYIDHTGKIVISPRFSRVEDFSEGLAVVKIGKGLPIDYWNITAERESYYAGREAKYSSCIDRNGAVVIERCGDPLSDDELAQKFPFGGAFGRGFVDGLYFSKTRVGGATVYGYQNKRGKYVWIQPHGKNVKSPKSWP